MESVGPQAVGARSGIEDSAGDGAGDQAMRTTGGAVAKGRTKSTQDAMKACWARPGCTTSTCRTAANKKLCALGTWVGATGQQWPRQ